MTSDTYTNTSYSSHEHFQVQIHALGWCPPCFMFRIAIGLSREWFCDYRSGPVISSYVPSSICWGYSSKKYLVWMTQRSAPVVEESTDSFQHFKYWKTEK